MVLKKIGRQDRDWINEVWLTNIAICKLSPPTPLCLCSQGCHGTRSCKSEWFAYHKRPVNKETKHTEGGGPSQESAHCHETADSGAARSFTGVRERGVAAEEKFRDNIIS